jgi:hypothetical protein
MDLVVAGLENEPTQYLDVSVVGPDPALATPTATSAFSRSDVAKLVDNMSVELRTELEGAGVNVSRLAVRDAMIGRQITKREKEKENIYRALMADEPLPERPEFVPLVLSTGGTASATFTKFIKELNKATYIRKADSIQGGSLDGNHHAYAALTNWAYQALSRRLVLNFSKFFNEGVRLGG